MKKQLPTIILAIVGILLAWTLYYSKKENAQLKQNVELQQEQTTEQQEAATPAQRSETPKTAATISEPAASDEADEAEKASGQRMMKNLAKMMDNPTMNKVMEASQRGAVGALYSDLIEYLGLDAEETNYFMDLLMHRQMKNMELGMKLMSGNLSEEEKTALADELKTIADQVQEEMKAFLNDSEDIAEFEFYEKTMGERMMLSQMDQQLAASGASLSDETYRDVLSMMHDEKKNYDFSTDLNDEKSMNLSPERFSKANLERFSNDMDQLNGNILERARNMLTSEQLTAFESAIQTTAEMQKSQMAMAAQMFGGGEK